MPLIRSAKKKLRQDKKKKIRNMRVENSYKKEVHRLKKRASSQKELDKAYSSIDKAVKKGIIHKNKARRLKSRVSQFINKK